MEDITKEAFQSFEKVRQSGVVNMYDAKTGCWISGLTKDEGLGVMENYDALNEKWPDVRGFKL